MCAVQWPKVMPMQVPNALHDPAKDENDRLARPHKIQQLQPQSLDLIKHSQAIAQWKERNQSLLLIDSAGGYRLAFTIGIELGTVGVMIEALKQSPNIEVIGDD
jgi:predicted nucleic acid-binding protein